MIWYILIKKVLKKLLKIFIPIS